MTLTKVMKSIQELILKDVGIDGDAQQISQLSWMMFYKIFSSQDLELKADDPEYVSPIPAGLRWDEWAYSNWIDKVEIEGDELLEIVNTLLFPALRDLKFNDLDAKTTSWQRAKLLQSVFANTYNYMRSGSLFRQVVNKLNDGIDFDESKSKHIFGDIYEQVLKNLQGAGKSGEFYTPRVVTQFIVDVIDPQLGETILDPACGTGGFLTCAYEHLKTQAMTDEELKIAKWAIRGVEKKQLPHLLCTTNMMAHGIEIPTGIMHDNALLKSPKEYTDRDRVNIIVANPPYGGTEEEGIGEDFLPGVPLRETADLFLILIIEKLLQKGRAAVVLPDSIMFGNGVKASLKQKLVETCNLHTIVRLPMGVFSPYTNIRTNILFFDKGTPTEETWYYEVVCPPGVRAYSKTKPIKDKDLEPIKEWWNNRTESDRAWKISIDQLVANNYDLEIKNPRAPKSFKEDFAGILKQYQNAITEAVKLRDNLKQELMHILQR